MRYSTSPVQIETSDLRARVTMRDSATGTEFAESFDLVIGADGLRSTVRRLAFGPDENYIKNQQAAVAAILSGIGRRNERSFVHILER